MTLLHVFKKITHPGAEIMYPNPLNLISFEIKKKKIEKRAFT
jgi:hypothetical protein